MASSKGYLEFVLDQLSGLRGITHRAMMGEYIIYYQGKVIGGIYDDRFLVKNTASAKQLMPDAPLEMPYEGGSPMILVEEIDDREFLEKLFDSMVDELPAPKTKKRG
ncbi:MAG: TfoX/Sxy family protein [Oscillospiraceae bacterium]|nr:TfoX/Sxy family protein [Oscillospiraceae bacterium]